MQYKWKSTATYNHAWILNQDTDQLQRREEAQSQWMIYTKAKGCIFWGNYIEIMENARYEQDRTKLHNQHIPGRKLRK